MKSLYASISDFGSIANVNPFCKREEVLLKYWVQNNKQEAVRYFKENGFIKYGKAIINKDISELEEKYNSIVSKNDINTINKVDEIVNNYNEDIQTQVNNNVINEKQASVLKKELQSKVTTQLGRQTEDNTLNQTERISGQTISSRNSQMYYKTIYKDDQYLYKIGGRVDGISDNIIIEAKRRTKISNVRKNKYDLYQLMGYLYVTGVNKGKIVQNYENNIWNSDIETSKEWGIVNLDNRWDKFLNNDLMSFFNDLKTIPDNIESLINKPFITVDDDKRSYPVDNKKIEKSIISLIQSCII